MCASRKIQTFSQLRGPETHIRHAQGHQRAGAILGSVITSQNTIITVYEVESLKTDYAKL